MVDALALAAEEGRGHAAKCPGEALAACDPGMSEWGNPPGARPGTLGAIPKRAPGELKHLSTPRNREDSLSSGERTGRSPNPRGVSRLPPLPRGGWTGAPEETAVSSRTDRTLAEDRWNGSPQGVRVP